jgi:hypothetical protein
MSSARIIARRLRSLRSERHAYVQGHFGRETQVFPLAPFPGNNHAARRLPRKGHPIRNHAGADCTGVLHRLSERSRSRHFLEKGSGYVSSVVASTTTQRE